MNLVLDHRSSLTLEEIAHASAAPSLKLQISPETVGRMRQSESALELLIARGELLYGINTGFGPHVQIDSVSCSPEQRVSSLLNHLHCGLGSPTPQAIVRTTILLRAHTLSRGYSGVGPELVESLQSLLNESHQLPSIPELGSLGASGDLIPLSYIARAVQCRRALKPREALSLVNGFSYSLAWVILSQQRLSRLVTHAEELTGILYAVYGARRAALDPVLHAVAAVPEIAASAQAISRAAGEYCEAHNHPLQEVYSLRCAPQILGAIRHGLKQVEATLQACLRGVDDNPVIYAEPTPRAIHGGHFHAQSIAFAADQLSHYTAQASALAERQLAYLLRPENSGAPLLLAWQGGSQSGFAGAQLLATALLAEIRHDLLPSAALSIPTNGDNQDIVPMAATVARTAWRQTERFSNLLAILAMGLSQLWHLRQAGLATGPSFPVPQFLPDFKPLKTDRPFDQEIEEISAALIRF